MREHYQLIMQHLFQEIQLKKKKSGKRVLRKLARRLELYRAYYRLLHECEPVLLPYYPYPAYLVNRFWSGIDLMEAISKARYPSALDFFTWFCDSDTIAQEREEQW